MSSTRPSAVGHSYKDFTPQCGFENNVLNTVILNHVNMCMTLQMWFVGLRVEHSLLERTQTSDTNTTGEDTAARVYF